MAAEDWTDEETTLLLRLIGDNERLDLVASEFGRTVEELRRRLGELGIDSTSRRVVVKLPPPQLGP